MLGSATPSLSIPSADGADQAFHLVRGRLEVLVAGLIDELGAAGEVEAEAQAKDVVRAAIADSGYVVALHSERGGGDAYNRDDQQEGYGAKKSAPH